VGSHQSLDDRPGAPIRPASALGHARLDVAGMHRHPPSGHWHVRGVLVSCGAEAGGVDPLSASVGHD